MEEESVDLKSEKSTSKGWSITSMVLGIVGVVLFCIPFLPIICGVLAIIFAVMGRKRESSGDRRGVEAKTE